MESFLQMFFGAWWRGMVNLLKVPTFSISGITISLYQVILAFIVINICVTIWWKGAKY